MKSAFLLERIILFIFPTLGIDDVGDLVPWRCSAYNIDHMQTMDCLKPGVNK